MMETANAGKAIAPVRTPDPAIPEAHPAGNKHTILFLAANPAGTDGLRLDREARGIQKELEQSGYRDRFEFVTRWAAEPLDLLRELRKLKPTVVHFSGHGGHLGASEHGQQSRDVTVGADGPPQGIFFQSPDGRAQFVSTAALEETFAAAGGSVKLVVLNACYTDVQADALLSHVGCVVGMSGAIRDDAARSFAIGFYGGLGERESVASAYKQGCAAISLEGLPEGDRPQLKTRAGMDANQLVLAEPLVPEPGWIPTLLRTRPLVAYGLAALALAAFVALGRRFLESPRFAVIALAVGFAVIGLVVLFANIADRSEHYRRPATILVWLCSCLVAVWAGGVMIGAFTGWPLEVSALQSGSGSSRAAVPATSNAIEAALPKRTYRRSYYQGFSASPPPGATRYDDVWQIGESGDWTATLKDGVYRLCNSASNDTASYTNRLQNVVEGSTVDMSNGRVSLRVATEPPNTTYSGAGVLFRASRDTQNYLAFVLNPGPGVSLLEKRANRLKVLWSDGISPRPGGLTELRVEGLGERIALYVDDKLVRIQPVDLDRGDVGIMAYSTGCFLLDDLTMYAPVADKP